MRSIVAVAAAVVVAAVLFLPSLCSGGGPGCAEATPASECTAGPTTCESLVGISTDDTKALAAIAVAGGGAVAVVAFRHRRRTRTT